MQSLKRFFKLRKVESLIDDILAINELNFIKDMYFQNLMKHVKSIGKNTAEGLSKIFTQAFKKNIHNQKLTIRIICIIHQILRETDSFQLSDTLIQVLFQLCKQLKNLDQSFLTGLDNYLKTNFCLPYSKYLIKAYRKQSKDKFQQQKPKGKIELFNRTINNTKQKPLESIDLDFTIFNMVSDILKLNGDIHQMGRYYSQHQYIINVFLQMLRDFQIYYMKIKANFHKLIKLKQSQIDGDQKQKVYLYLIESERCVNKMNSFYLNKYLYYYVNSFITLKMQLQIPKTFYKTLNKSYLSHQRRPSHEVCLTASSCQSKFNHMNSSQTSQSNRSKTNQVSKIIQSITSLNQILDMMQQQENQQTIKRKQTF